MKRENYAECFPVAFRNSEFSLSYTDSYSKLEKTLYPAI